VGGDFQLNYAKNFNEYIGEWDVSSVTDMSSMVRNTCLLFAANAIIMETKRAKGKTHTNMGIIPRTVCFSQNVQSRHWPLEGWRRDNHEYDGKGCLHYDPPDKRNSHSHERMTIYLHSFTMPAHSIETLATGTWVLSHKLIIWCVWWLCELLHQSKSYTIGTLLWSTLLSFTEPNHSIKISANGT
jgi:hypothetical protein